MYICMCMHEYVSYVHVSVAIVFLMNVAKTIH